MTSVPRTHRTRAIVLRRTNYGEADRIIQLLTPEGKLSVIARGVRRPKSRLAGGIELFAVCDVVVHQGKGELGILTSARLVQFYRHILEDYDRLQFGYEAIRQIGRASELVAEPDWYEVLSQVLMGLDAPSVSEKLTETWFYVRFAALMGRELSLVNDTEGYRLDSEHRYTYDVGESGLRPSETGEITADHIKYLRLIAVKDIAIVAQVGGVDDILTDCWLLARQHAALDSR